MGVKSGNAIISAEIPAELKNRIVEEAKRRKVSVSFLVGEWLETAVPAPLIRKGKIQKIRKRHDELMVSVPMEFVRRAGVRKGDDVEISYGEHAIIISTVA